MTDDPTTGAVTVTAPDGGWEVPQGARDADGFTSRLSLVTHYRIPATVLPRSSLTSGLTFDVSGIEGRQGAEQWEGAVTKIPLFGPSGS